MIFHQFQLGDVEDPDIYAAHPLWEWQQTEKGRWVMEHGLELTYSIHPDIHNFGYKVSVTGSLTQDDEVYFTLKYQ